MADVKTVSSEDKWNLNAIYLNVIRECDNKNYIQAIKLSQEGLSLANKTNNKEWIQKFDLLYTQAISEYNNRKKFKGSLTESEVTTSMEIDYSNLREDNDLTQVKGIGESAQRNLNNAGINTITQLGSLTPQNLSKVKGFGLTTAQKIVVEVKKFVGDNRNYNDSNSKIPTLDKWQDLDSNNNNQESEDFTFDKIIAKKNPKDSDLIDKQSSGNYRNQLKEKMYNILNFNDDKAEVNKSENQSIVEAPIELNSKVLSYGKEEKPDIINNTSDDEYGEHQETDEANLIEEEYSDKALENLKEEEVNTENGGGQNLKIINNFLDEELSEFHNVSKISNINPPNDLNNELKLEILEKNRLNDIRKNVNQVLKTSEYFVMPKSYFTLKNNMNNYIDSIGIKVLSVKKDLDIIIITLIKICNLKGTLIVSDDNIEYQASSHNLELNNKTQSLLIRPIKEKLLQARSLIQQNIAAEGRLFEFFKKFLKIHISLEKSKNINNITFRSGLLQYQILIEPILLCQSDPISISKSIAYPFQIKSNIHFINYKDISKLIEFLEKKNELIKTYSPQNDVVEEYCKEKIKFINNLRLYSLPFVVFGFIFLLLLILQLDILVNSFIGLAVAAICLYPIVLLYSYLKFYKVKTVISNESDTPNFHGRVKLDETDLLMISKDQSPQDMDQFIYECFGKSAEFNIISKLEEQKIPRVISNYKRDREIDDSNNDPFDSPHQSVKYSSTKHLKDKRIYGSFLED